MVRTERNGHKKGQGGSDDDTSKDGESVSKQGKNKKNGDEPEPFDARETVDSKMHGKPFMSSGIAQKPSRSQVILAMTCSPTCDVANVANGNLPLGCRRVRLQ